jgi:hypothetical protein
VNPPESKVCVKCGKNLLPGEGIGERIEYLVIGIVGGVVTGAVGVWLANSGIELPECLPVSVTNCILAAIFMPIAGLVAAIRRTPRYKIYARRALHHTELDPQQAIADFTQALELAPEKEKAELYKNRAEMYEQLGMEEEATRDFLEYTSSEGAYETGRSITRMIGGDADVYAEGVAKEDRKKLVEAGKAVALGYCSKCGEVVQLNESMRCPEHPKKKVKFVRVVVPGEVDDARQEMVDEFTKLARTRKIVIIVLAIVIGLPLVCCLFSSLTRSLAPSQFEKTSTPSPTSKPLEPSPTILLSETPSPTITVLAQTSIPGTIFTDATVISLGWLEDGSFLITLEVPNGVDGKYWADVGNHAFECDILEDFPDRLYCHGIGVKSGMQVAVSWYRGKVDMPLFETEITVP